MCGVQDISESRGLTNLGGILSHSLARKRFQLLWHILYYDRAMMSFRPILLVFPFAPQRKIFTFHDAMPVSRGIQASDAWILPFAHSDRALLRAPFCPYAHDLSLFVLGWLPRRADAYYTDYCGASQRLRTFVDPLRWIGACRITSAPFRTGLLAKVRFFTLVWLNLHFHRSCHHKKALLSSE